MSFSSVQCPRCGRSLTISNNAPLWLICPKCLGRVQNPAGRPPGQRPVTVIPLDRQVQSDFSASRPLQWVLVALIVFGIVTIDVTMGPRPAAFPLLLVGAAAVVWVGFYLRSERSDSCTTGCLAIAAPVAIIFLGIVALLFGLCATAFLTH